MYPAFPTIAEKNSTFRAFAIPRHCLGVGCPEKKHVTDPRATEETHNLIIILLFPAGKPAPQEKYFRRKPLVVSFFSHGVHSDGLVPELGVNFRAVRERIIPE